MNATMGERIAHSKRKCLEIAAKDQKRADGYRTKGWLKAAAEWDRMAARWREQAETAPE